VTARTKTLLIASVVTLGCGLVIEVFLSPKTMPALHVVLPVGFIFIGLFLVSFLFEKEEKAYGEDQKRTLGDAGESPKDPPADRV
jgi:hypothetical protein